MRFWSYKLSQIRPSLAPIEAGDRKILFVEKGGKKLRKQAI